MRSRRPCKSRESGEVQIDIAFIGAPTCGDEYGNMRANDGKSDCGVLSYAMVEVLSTQTESRSNH